MAGLPFEPRVEGKYFGINSADGVDGINLLTAAREGGRMSQKYCGGARVHLLSPTAQVGNAEIMAVSWEG